MSTTLTPEELEELLPLTSASFSEGERPALVPMALAFLRGAVTADEVETASALGGPSGVDALLRSRGVTISRRRWRALEQSDEGAW